MTNKDFHLNYLSINNTTFFSYSQLCGHVISQPVRYNRYFQIPNTIIATKVVYVLDFHISRLFFSFNTLIQATLASAINPSPVRYRVYVRAFEYFSYMLSISAYTVFTVFGDNFVITQLRFSVKMLLFTSYKVSNLKSLDNIITCDIFLNPYLLYKTRQIIARKKYMTIIAPDFNRNVVKIKSLCIVFFI